MTASIDVDEVARTLLGVRTARSAPLAFVSAPGLVAPPGTRVVVRLDAADGEQEAIVVVGTGQIVFAGGVSPAGIALRVA